MTTRPARAIMIMAPALACATAWGGDVCDDAAGDCFEVHPEPGCNIPECCEFVCSIEPFCCAQTWDATCVLLATDNCEPPVCPGKGPCFEPHDEPGCSDADCCNLVCDLDPFCCDAVWDAQCVAVASAACPAGFCTITIPPDAVAEPEPCGENLNGGCNSPPFLFTPIACGDRFWGTTRASGPRDTDWYEITVAAETRLTWTATTEFPAILALAGGDCEDGFFVLAASNASGCAPGTLDVCVDPGRWWLVITPGTELAGIFNGIRCDDPKKDPGVVGNRYVIDLACDACGADPCPADVDGDGDVDVDDLVAVLTGWGPNPGAGDIDGDGDVDVDDLVAVLTAWGPCP